MRTPGAYRGVQSQPELVHELNDADVVDDRVIGAPDESATKADAGQLAVAIVEDELAVA